MKKYLFLIIVLLVALSLFLIKHIQKPSVKFHALQDNSWRAIVLYQKIERLPLEKRHEIFRQFIGEVSLGITPDSAYIIVAKNNDISSEDVRNIIGEAIASNWKKENDDSSASHQK